MELVSIAKPYANAIFEIATQNKSHAQWKEVLVAAVQLVSDKSMQGFLASPSTRKSSKVESISSLLGAIMSRDLSSEEESFINILLENGRTQALPSILDLFEKSVNLTSDSKTFQVVSAYKLSAKEEERIVNVLSDKYDARVSVDTFIDTSLVGGVVIKDGDKVIDTSIQARVNELNMQLSIN